MTRTYAWSIDKELGQFDGTVPAGTSVQVPYTVSVDSTGHTDSAWAVSGTITVANPNEWQSVTLTGVSDVLGDGTACAITSGEVNGTIAANAKRRTENPMMRKAIARGCSESDRHVPPEMEEIRVIGRTFPTA